MSLNRLFSRLAAVVLVALLQTGLAFQDFVPQAHGDEAAATTSPWTFGIVGDTQWSGADDGQSPNSIPAGILKQIHKEFVRHGVSFVVAVGDTVDKSTPDNIAARALYVQDLYNAGIGFYPLRGNHEAGWGGPDGSGPAFQRAFPQTRDGVNNATPTYAAGIGVGSQIAPDPKTNPQTFVVGTGFNSPDLTCNGVAKAGLSYSFDFHNARCILLDQWDDTGSTSASTIPEQQEWIDARLGDANRPQHAFVFGHKCLLGPKNKNNLFGNPINGDDPGDASGVDVAQLTPEQKAILAAKRGAMDAFVRSLATQNVPLYLCGHDHIHYRSIVTSPDGTATVQQVSTQSASNKFNFLQPPMSPNDTAVSLDLNKIGFYICTVDGPRVTIDYYGAPVDAVYRFSARTSDSAGKTPAKPKNCVISKTPDLTGQWEKLETFGYSLNGRAFLVPKGQTYTMVQDNTDKAMTNGETGYLGTTAKILAGVNGNTAATSDGTALSKAVHSGWAPAAATASDVFTLWGTETVTDSHSDTFTLALSFHPNGLSADQWSAGLVALATKDDKGNWINAVDANVGGEKKFVLGDYDSSFGLGTYGVNPATHTAWAVVNHSGAFAVAVLPKPQAFDQQTHTVEQLNPNKEPVSMPAEMQLISKPWDGDNSRMPYLVFMPEKDRLLLLVDCNKKAALLHSDDHGKTWSSRRWLSEAGDDRLATRAIGLTYLEQGKLVAASGNGLATSCDFGQTWTFREWNRSSQPLSWWDPLLVVRDAAGRLERLAIASHTTTGLPWGSAETPFSQGFLQSSTDEGRSWSEPIKIPEWRDVGETSMIIAQNGDWVAACRLSCPLRFAPLAIGRQHPGKEDFNFDDDEFAQAHLATFGRRAGGAHWDHYCGLGVSVSKDQGKTWSDVRTLFEWGRHHPSMVLLPDGRILMSYVVRLGYPDTADGFPQFGVEAVLSSDNGQTWDLDRRYVLARWVGRIKGENAYFCSVQSTSTVLLPDGMLLTAFGTGFNSPETERKKDVALVRWRLSSAP